VALVGGSAQHVAWSRAWLAHWCVEEASGAPPLTLSGEPPPSGAVSDLQARLDAATVTTPAIADQAPAQTGARHAAATPMRCVLCDDEPTILRVLEQLLRQAGHDVVCFESPQPMLLYLTAAPADVIVLDVNLGDESGLDVLRQLRGKARTADVPVCMLSGSMDFRDACLEAGADDYLVKPSSLDEILATVARLGAGRSIYRDTCVST
jgi:CheY-like chemotaxis protein